MSGSFTELPLTAEHHQYISDMSPNLARVAGRKGATYTAVRVYEQPISNGRILWYHLLEDQNGSQWSACIEEPKEDEILGPS